MFLLLLLLYLFNYYHIIIIFIIIIIIIITTKEFTKRFYDIVSASFAAIFPYKKSQVPPYQQGHGVPSKVEGGTRALRLSLYFSMVKPKKRRFS